MSSQKYIARNQAPRVQIEYDVERYGAEIKKELPFVMAVLADLTGNAPRGGEPDEGGQAAAPALPPLAERKLTDISADTFDSSMAALKPGVSVRVPNTLTGEGNLSLTMRFEELNDFSPAAIARNVPQLKRLLEARQQLANLLAFMDGKEDAEELVAQILKDPGAFAALKSSPTQQPSTPEAGGKGTEEP